MAASINAFVNVDVTVAAATPTRFSFGNFMGLFEHDITTNRLDGPYASVAEGVAAGFTSVAAPEIYYWMSSAFAQDDAVDAVYIGRKIPATGGTLDQVWQVDDTGPAFVDMTTEANDATVNNWIIFPAAEAIGDYCAIGSAVPFTGVTFDNTGGVQGVGGVVTWKYWNGSSWANLAGVTDNTTGFTAAVGVQTLTFTQPADWATCELNATGGQLYYIIAEVTTVYGTNPQYDKGFITGDADWDDALDQITAVNGPESWYGHTIGSRVKADIVTVAAWTEANDTHMFFPQSADADFLNGTAGNVALTLQSSSYKRTAGPIYHLTSSGAANGYLDGAWGSSGFGMDLDAPNGRGIWAYRELEGITYDNVTSAQASAIWGANGNLYGRNKGLSFTSKGTTAYGTPYFIDIQTTIDWIKMRLEEDIVALFVAQNVVPYTDTGINLVVAAVKERLDKGVTFGHFSPDTEPEVVAPLAANISSTVKQTRVLTLTASAVFAGGVQKLDLTLAVNF